MRGPRVVSDSSERSHMAEETTATTKQKATGLAVVAYLFGLVSGIILFLISKDKFVRFHALQSIGFSVVAAIIQYVIGAAPVVGGGLSWLVNLIVFVLWIMLMVKAYQGEEYKLPVIGDWAAKTA